MSASYSTTKHRPGGQIGRAEVSGSVRGTSAGLDAAIQLDGVVVRYDSGPETVQAVDGVSLTLPPKSLTAVMGASGSGKSTLLNLMGGLETVTQGTVLVDGRDITSWSEDQRADLRLETVGMVFQDDNLIPVLTALENVTLPLRARGWSTDDSDREGKSWLDRVGIGELTDRRPAEMSGGQRQRVGIARAIAGGHSILLADEPTGALDSKTSREILGILRELADGGVCVVVVSHDPVVRDYADAVVEMQDGHLLESDLVTLR